MLECIFQVNLDSFDNDDREKKRDSLDMHCKLLSSCSLKRNKKKTNYNIRLMQVDYNEADGKYHGVCFKIQKKASMINFD